MNEPSIVTAACVRHCVSTAQVRSNAARDLDTSMTVPRRCSRSALLIHTHRTLGTSTPRCSRARQYSSSTGESPPSLDATHTPVCGLHSHPSFPTTYSSPAVLDQSTPSCKRALARVSLPIALVPLASEREACLQGSRSRGVREGGSGELPEERTVHVL